MKVHKEQHNLNDLILNVLDDIVINTKEEELRGGHADNNRCKLLYKACEEEIIIQADKTRLIQVIYNLLHNAMKFTKEGTISILVEKKKDDENNNNQ